jgi:hypothetical protein
MNFSDGLREVLQPSDRGVILKSEIIKIIQTSKFVGDFPHQSAIIVDSPSVVLFDDVLQTFFQIARGSKIFSQEPQLWYYQFNRRDVKGECFKRSHN